MAYIAVKFTNKLGSDSVDKNIFKKVAKLFGHYKKSL